MKSHLPASVLCLALTVSPLLAHDGSHGHEQVQEVSMAEERLALPNLPVTDRWGDRGGFRDKVGRDRSVILSFSYTECESLCNVTNALLSVVDAGLEADPNADLRIVTVAIDARRDTPEARDAGAGTVTQMTFHDQGRTISPAKVARDQLTAFFAAQGRRALRRG